MKGAQDQGANGGLTPPPEFPRHPGEEFPGYPGIHSYGGVYWAIDADGVWHRVNSTKDESVDR